MRWWDGGGEVHCGCIRSLRVNETWAICDVAGKGDPPPQPPVCLRECAMGAREGEANSTYLKDAEKASQKRGH